MCYCDYEPVELYEDAPVKAKQAHTCHECGDTIAPGEVYLSASYLFESAWHSYKRCARCHVVWQHATRNDKCACIAFGMLANYIADGVGSFYPEQAKGFADIIGSYQREHRIERPNLIRHYWRHRAAVRSLCKQHRERMVNAAQRKALHDARWNRLFPEFTNA